MKQKIGFAMGEAEQEYTKGPEYDRISNEGRTLAPRRSLVRVHIPDRGMTLTYYNDRFDLQCGDLVYVSGKLEGLRGYVREVQYNFKIKVSDYEKVIAVADTEVHGQFFIAGTQLVTFEPVTLPKEKVARWFIAPASEEEELISGNGEESFLLYELKGMNVKPEIVERGLEYYRHNQVKYLCIDGINGYAIVEGRENYEVEFEFDYEKGEICHLTCNCFCTCNCKHEVATMLQLRETLDYVVEKYRGRFESGGYFAVIAKDTFFQFAVDGKAEGCFTLV